MHSSSVSSQMSSPNRAVSPARSHYERYISLMPDEISPPNHLRTHPRSSSTNPVQRTHHHERSFHPRACKPYDMTFESSCITSLAQPSNLVAVGTKTKSLSLLIDRSNDFKRKTLEYNRNNSNNTFNTSFSNAQQNNFNKNHKFYSFINNQWDRASADRDVPLAYLNQPAPSTARSLDREGLLPDEYFPVLHDDNDVYITSGNDTPSPSYYSQSKDAYVLDLQAQVATLNKECAMLQQDLDLAKDKLTSTMSSIKTFWSPELKKERSLRKEDNSKYVTLCDQLKSVEIENRQHVKALMQLEVENRELKGQQSQAVLKGHQCTNAASRGTDASNNRQACNNDLLKKERERHSKEMNLLRKAMQEMELRIEMQQKTMATRDETIKKLMDFLQQQKCRRGDEVRVGVGDVVSHEKDNVIQSLYTQLYSVQDKLKISEHDKTIKEGEMRLLQGRLESSEKVKMSLDTELEEIKKELCTRELCSKNALRELEGVRTVLRDREVNVETKMKQITTLQSEKLKLAADLASTNEQLLTTTYALSSANKKIERLEDDVKEKEHRLLHTNHQLSSIQADCSSRSDVLDTLKHVITDKEKQIDKLREQKDRQKKEMEEEIEEVNSRSNEVKNKVKSLQEDLLSKQETEMELRNEVGRLKGEMGAKDKLMSRQEIDLCDVTDQLQQCRQLLNKTQEEAKKKETEFKTRLVEVKQAMQDGEKECTLTEVTESKMEVERLNGKLEEMEGVLQSKCKTISSLKAELLLADKSDKVAGTSEECEDASNVKRILVEKDGRINELEGALKESIKITAQREVVMAEQQMRLEHTERLLEAMNEEAEVLKEEIEKFKNQSDKMEMAVKEKDELLKEQFDVSKKQLSEVYEMKQEAILAAISEKDAHIALLEMASNKKVENIQEVEKLSGEKMKLQSILRDLTHSRMKLLQHRGHMRSSSASSLLHYTHRDEVMQKIDFGTYYVYHNEFLPDDDVAS